MKGNSWRPLGCALGLLVAGAVLVGGATTNNAAAQSVASAAERARRSLCRPAMRCDPSPCAHFGVHGACEPGEKCKRVRICH
jgi:hypothetical protein